MAGDCARLKSLLEKCQADHPDWVEDLKSIIWGSGTPVTPAEGAKITAWAQEHDPHFLADALEGCQGVEFTGAPTHEEWVQQGKAELVQDLTLGATSVGADQGWATGLGDTLTSIHDTLQRAITPTRLMIGGAVLVGLVVLAVALR